MALAARRPAEGLLWLLRAHWRNGGCLDDLLAQMLARRRVTSRLRVTTAEVQPSGFAGPSGPVGSWSRSPVGRKAEVQTKPQYFQPRRSRAGFQPLHSHVHSGGQRPEFLSRKPRFLRVLYRPFGIVGRASWPRVHGAGLSPRHRGGSGYSSPPRLLVFDGAGADGESFASRPWVAGEGMAVVKRGRERDLARPARIHAGAEGP